MQFNLLTGLLALSAPLIALAAPTTTSAAAAATTSSAQPAINNAWEVVSSLSSTLNWHEVSINFTVAFLPESPSDAQKASCNSSVSVDVSAMSEAIRAAVTTVRDIERIAGHASAAEAREVKRVTDALSALVYRSTGTVKHAADVFHSADIVIVGGGVFSPFVALFEDFVIGVEDVFLGFAPSVEVLANSLIAVLETILVVL